MTKAQMPAAKAHVADPELAPLEASFERGDFAAVHAQLARLPAEKIATAGAHRLRGATSVDPAHVGVLVLCVLALIAITLKYLS